MMKMIKTMVAMAVALAAVVAHAGASAPFPLDTLDGPRVARDVETIAYSTAWADGAPAGAQAVVAVDGETLSAASGEGEVAWTHPARTGTFTLTHRVVSGGTQYGETQTATFLVRGPDAPVFTPPSGTTIEDGSLTVTISCPTEGATIHYTTDGTEPTEQSPEYRRFRVSAKTVVKAVAVTNGVLSKVAVAEYAPGRCAVPVVSPADGASFAHSNQVVSIAWGNDGVLRYTLDGTDPTAVSAAYAGPFTVHESTVVKAKVFSDELFDSHVATARLTRVWTRVATPVIDAAATFAGPRTRVELSCATDGALIRYTLDGADPDSGSTVYTEPFYVTNSCTVKAYAALADCLDSATATFAIEKLWNPGDALGAPEHAFYTDGDGGLGWTRVADATAPNGEAMRSGAITHGQSSVLSTTVTGPGTLSFAWRTSCEDDPMYEWDHAEFAVDGTVVRRLCGVTAWTNECVEIAGDGAHAVEWRYVKDDVESEGEDAAWVADYRWEGAWTATRTTVVPVPYAWLAAHVPGVADEYEEYEAAAKATAANGRKVWECYGLDLDPGEATNDFRIASFQMRADGTPDLENLELDPPPSRWNVPATWKVLGAATLEGPWEEVPAEGGSPGTARPTMRFFKVEVRLIGVPGDVAASSGSSDAVNLTWSAVADATGYEVWRGTGTAINGAERIAVVSDATSYADTAAVAGTTYRYWIRSVSGDVYGAFSEPVVGIMARGKVRLWAGGPYWATTNIGAEEPEDYGYYFWWGDTVGYRRENNAWVASDGSSSGFSFSSGNVPTCNKGIAALRGEGWITADGVLAPAHDAAHVLWGGEWRMPTDQELVSLTNMCDWTWTTMNGVNGYVVRGRGDYASASIFLPVAGFGSGTSLNSAGSTGTHWSSVPYSDSNKAWRLGFSSGNRYTDAYNRYRGQSIRPVQGPKSVTVTFNANGGTVSPASQPYAANGTYGSLPPPSYTGYIFLGWFTAASGGTQVTASSVVPATNTTLYAHWTADAGSHGKVQLWAGGPFWATTNIGAENPEDYGYYFWWGDTVGYRRVNNAWVASDGSSSGFSFSAGNAPTYNEDIASLQSEGWITADGVLASAHDAARAHWGGKWRMPTKDEISALNSNCDWTWTTMNGVNGYVVRGRGEYAAASIFLPAAGFGRGTSLISAGSYGDYWSSVPRSDSYNAWGLYFGSSDHRTDYGSRFCGQSVRPVQGFSE